MTTPEVLAAKLTDLASQVPLYTCIVELGTFHGKGCIALAKGAQNGVEVFTVDDYREKRGWIGEPYSPDDALVFVENVKAAEVHVTLSRMGFDSAAQSWTRAVGLLYWDPGIPNRFENDWRSWSPFIVDGGVFIIKDASEGQLGTFPVIERILEGGDWEKFDYWMGVSFLRMMK